MPRYDYRCASCDYEFEAEHGMQDEDVLVECPECGRETLQRLISKTAFRLKQGGVGWALNGYHNDGCRHYDLGDITAEDKRAGKRTIHENRDRALKSIKDTS